jgi:hypothetical protein
MKPSGDRGDRVTVPKERLDENTIMNNDPRPHIHRRGNAIDRLRSLTTGAAIAGLAGTAGFGVLAAATWSGTATAADQADGTTTNDATGLDGGYGTTGTNGTTGAGGTSGTTRPRPAPTAATNQQPTTTIPRVQRVSGGGHASSGGSH